MVARFMMVTMSAMVLGLAVALLATPAPALATCGLGTLEVSVRELGSGRPVSGATASLEATPLRAGPLAGSTWRFSGLDTCGGFGGSNEYRVRLAPPAGWIVAGSSVVAARLTPFGRADFLLTDGASVVAASDRVYGGVLASNSSNIARFTGGQPRQGAVVFYAAGGCPLARAGLGVGDVITSIDGQPVGGWREFDSRWFVSTGPASVTVARKGRSDESTLQIAPIASSDGCDWASLDAPSASMPDDPILLMAKAFDTSDPAESERLFRRVTAIAPDFGQPWGELALKTDEPAEARRLTDRAITLDPGLVEFRVSLCSRDAGTDWVAYTACNEQSLRINANSAVVNNDLAWGLAHLQRDLDRSQALAERAVTLAPTQAHQWDTLGYVYLVRGDRPSAIVAYTQALSLCTASDDDCTASRRTLALVRAGSNDPYS